MRKKRFLPRFRLRSIFVLMTLMCLLCYFVMNWRTLLVEIRADRILVPNGVALYAHPPNTQYSPDMSFQPADSVEFIAEANCQLCHNGLGSAWLVFPYPKD